MTTNPEASVIDAIDALIDEQLAGGEYAAIERTETVVADRDRCKLCSGAWHGSPWTGVDHDHLGEYDRHSHGRAMRCPGAFATGPQRIRYRRERARNTEGCRNRSLTERLGGLGNPVRELDSDRLARMRRALRDARDAIEVLTEGGPALQSWQREQLAALYVGPPSRPPLVMQFPRQFGHPNRLMSIPDGFSEVGFIGEGDGVTLTPRGPEVDYVVMDEPFTGPESRIWFGPPPRHTAEAGNPTLPKVYMVPGRGGRQSVTRPWPNSLALLRYWGSPQAPGDWWEMDVTGIPWINVAVTREQDEPPRRRQGRGSSWPPLQRVFIELTAASGLHVNPIGLIAVGHGGPGASGTVRRAYLKSLGDHPPLLYDDERRTSAWQPTLWRWRGDRRTRPERLVDAIRGAEGL